MDNQGGAGSCSTVQPLVFRPCFLLSAEVRSRPYICGTVMSRWETFQPTKVWTPMPRQKEPWSAWVVSKKVAQQAFGMEKFIGFDGV